MHVGGPQPRVVESSHLIAASGLTQRLAIQRELVLAVSVFRFDVDVEIALGAAGALVVLSRRPASSVLHHRRRLAAMSVLAPKLGSFAREYPDVVLEVTSSTESHVDLLVAGRFNAGIHYGEFIERDMIASFPRLLSLLPSRRY